MPVLSGPRLALASYGEDDNHGPYILSGFANCLEQYSICRCDSEQKSLKISLCSPFEAYSKTKFPISGIHALANNKRKLVVGFGNYGIFLASMGKEKPNCSDFYFKDWVQNARLFESEDKISLVVLFNSGKLCKFHVSEETNNNFSLKMVDERALNIRNMAIFSSVLHSTASEETPDDLLVFVGTIFGEVLVFCRPFSEGETTKEGGDPICVISGHEGMVFSMVVDGKRQILTTAGDDRALRVWDISGLISEKKSDGRKDVKQLAKKFGHGARIFSVAISPETGEIFTGGADSYICHWKWKNQSPKSEDCLFLADRIDLGPNCSTVRSLLIIPVRDDKRKRNENLLVFGTEHGGLSAIPLSSNNADDGDSFCEKNSQRKNKKAFGFHFISPSDYFYFDKEKKLLFQRGDSSPFPVIFDETITSSNEKLRCDSLSSNREFIHNRTKDLICSVLSSSKIHFFFDFDEPTHFSLSPPTLDFAGEALSHSLWLDADHFLAISGRGIGMLYFVVSNSTKETGEKFLSIEYQQKLVLRPGVTIQSGAISDSFYNHRRCLLFLGTRTGKILVFLLRQKKQNSSEENDCSEIEQEPLPPIRIVRDAHDGRQTVTAIKCFPIGIRAEGIEEEHRLLISLGRDGTLRKWRVLVRGRGNFPDEISSMELFQLSLQRTPIEWPSDFLSDPSGENDGEKEKLRFIVCFHSNDFVVLERRSLRAVARFPCGGGNRIWQCQQLTDEETGRNALGFSYIARGELHRVRLPLRHSIAISPGLHSLGNVTAICSISPSENDCRKETIRVLTAGADGALTISQLIRFSFDSIEKADDFLLRLRPLSTNRQHISTVFNAVSVVTLEEKGDKMEHCCWVFSGGGRSEVLAFALSPDLNELEFRCRWVPPQEKEQTMDLRVLAIRELPLFKSTHKTNENSDGTSSILATLAVCFSDATIRFLHLLSAQKPFEGEGNVKSSNFLPVSKNNRFSLVEACPPISHPSLALFTKMDAISLNSMCCLLLAASTCGNIFIFLLGQKDEKEEINGKKEIRLAPDKPKMFPVERCGLSALAVFSEENLQKSCGSQLAPSLAFVGSESGSITPMVLFSERNERGFGNVGEDGFSTEILPSLKSHFSTVTAIKVQNLPQSRLSSLVVASVGLDCRLNLHRFSVGDGKNKRSFELIHSLPLAVPDPTCILLLINKESEEEKEEKEHYAGGFCSIVAGFGAELVPNLERFF